MLTGPSQWIVGPLPPCCYAPECRCERSTTILTADLKQSIVSETTFNLIPFCDLSSFNFTILSLNQETVFLRSITSTINTVSVISTPCWTISAAQRQRCVHDAAQFAVWTEMMVTGKMFRNSRLSAAPVFNRGTRHCLFLLRYWPCYLSSIKSSCQMSVSRVTLTVYIAGFYFKWSEIKPLFSLFLFLV